jgi:hypothetical protein
MKSDCLILLASFATVFFTSCSGGTSGSGEAAISTDTLVQVLVEIHLADADNKTKGIRDWQDDAASQEVTQTLAFHHISTEEFHSTMKWYADHPDQLVGIYDKVIEELTKMQSPRPNQR